MGVTASARRPISSGGRTPQGAHRSRDSFSPCGAYDRYMWPRGRPRDDWAPGWLDVAIAVPLTVFAQAELVLIHRSEPLAVVLSLLITGALLWRSRGLGTGEGERRVHRD